MRKFIMKNKKIIPANRMSDVRSLKKFIEEKLDIQISLMDTYLFWDHVSDSWCAGWLAITTHYDDMTREEFLEYELEKYGVILDDEDSEDDYEN